MVFHPCNIMLRRDIHERKENNSNMTLSTSMSTTPRIPEKTTTTSTTTTNDSGLSKENENLMITVLAVTFLITWTACLGIACKRRFRHVQERRAQQLAEHNTAHQYDPPTYKVALGMPKPDVCAEFVVRDENGIHVVIVEKNGEVCETNYSMSRETPQVQESHHVFHFGEYSGLGDIQHYNITPSSSSEPTPQTSAMSDSIISRQGQTLQAPDSVSHTHESQGNQIIRPRKGQTLEAAIRAHAIPLHARSSREEPHNLSHPGNTKSTVNPGYPHVRDPVTPIRPISSDATGSKNTTVWVVSSLYNSKAEPSGYVLPDYDWAVGQASHITPVHSTDCVTHL